MPSLDHIGLTSIEMIDEAKARLIRVVGEGTFASEQIVSLLDEIAEVIREEHADWELVVDLIQEEEDAAYEWVA